jgi:peptidoglycan-associated lipoprotein
VKINRKKEPNMSKTFKLLALIAMLSISACSNKDASMEGMSDMDGYSEIDLATDGEEISGEDLENYEPDADANIAFMSDVVNIVFFEFDSSELNEESRITLQDQAAWLEVNPETEIMIEGHCDERGTREYNLALGARRAAKTKAYLVALGINGDRVSTISYGKERPMILDSTESAWNKNRRSVTILY